MDLREQLAKDLFGDNIIFGVAKLYARPASGGDGPSGEKRTLIAGVIVTENPLCKGGRGEIGVNDRMYECEVVIIPRSVFEASKFESGKRIDQILVGGYGDPRMYKKKIL
jgi:hypothetical protein